MGWLYCSSTRRDLIADLTADAAWTTTDGQTVTRRTVKKRQTSNRLWVLHEVTRSDGFQDRFIVLYILSRSEGRWGYKDLCSATHPFWYDCPLAWLDQVGPPASKLEIEWRENVRLHHANRVPTVASPSIQDRVSVPG